MGFIIRIGSRKLDLSGRHPQLVLPTVPSRFALRGGLHFLLAPLYLTVPFASLGTWLRVNHKPCLSGLVQAEIGLAGTAVLYCTVCFATVGGQP